MTGDRGFNWSEIRAMSGAPTFSGHLQIARLDHWIKNVFVLPGVIIAYAFTAKPLTPASIVQLAVGLLAVCLMASSNYVLNEVLDAAFDRLHPSKRSRPVPSGRVNVPLAVIEWLALMIASLCLGSKISRPFVITLGLFFFMGLLYNIPPVRTKDWPYLDVLTEALNNPLRLLAGWFIVDPNTFPPGSLLASYWMIGCYFMAIKRFAELQTIDERDLTLYRPAFRSYTPERLLVSITFYAATSMLFFGAFIMRYRFELILSFPFIALVMAVYLSLGFKPDSAAQEPEKLYKEKFLLFSILLCAAVMLVLLLVDLPRLLELFAPWFPLWAHRT